MSVADEIRARKEAEDRERDDAWGQRTLRAGARRRDQHLHRAYLAGRRGESADDFAGDPDALDAYNTGSDERRTGAPQSRKAPAPAFNPGSAMDLSWVDDGSGLVLGMLLAYPVLVNWTRYGWPGVTGWFSAKFANRVTFRGPAK